MTLPNGSDVIPIEEIFHNDEGAEIKLDRILFINLICDLHYAQGYVEGIEQILKQKTKELSGAQQNPNHRAIGE